MAVLAVLSLFFLVSVSSANSLQVRKFPLLMPNVRPDRDELYLCTPVKIVPNKTFYIVGFDPNASMQTVHHMMLFGCPRPGADTAYWDCGEMAVSESSKNLTRANPCSEESHVLYAWARDAKTLQLPPDVGFQVGQGTEIQYLILQVHYSKKFEGDATDNSGIFLMYTEEVRSRLAGVVLLGTGGYIRGNSTTHMEASCRVNESKTIYPFAYRTHTHSLGKVVAGYRVRKNEYGHDDWMLLGKRDPLTPQMFYPVNNTDPITYGDVLAARCTMHSDRTEVTRVGPTNKDEMCNFYLMYYVKEGTPLDMKYCITSGPPQFFWKNNENNLDNIPDKEASTL